MVDPETDLSTSGKRSLSTTERDSLSNNGEKRTKVSNDIDESDNTKEDKKKSVTKKFREWSNNINDSSETSTVFTLKCIFGNPEEPLKSWIKTSKVGEIRSMLAMRKLPTDGSKAVLLKRFQTDLPSVTLDIDSRECLQRVVNSMIYNFGWQNVHLFECKFPARGDLMEGVLGNTRKLTGSGFHPHSMNSFNQYDEENAADGGWFSLKELALEKGDKIHVMYDYGDNNEFTIEVKEIKSNTNVLKEVSHYGHKTRVTLVERGSAKMRKQYNDGSDPY